MIEFGVESVIMQRVKAAAAETKLAGSSLVRSAWRFSEPGDTREHSTTSANELAASTRHAIHQHNLTVPIGFKGRLLLPKYVGGTPLNMLRESAGLDKGRIVWTLGSTSIYRESDVQSDGILSVSADTDSVESLVVLLGAGTFTFSASYGW